MFEFGPYRLEPAESRLTRDGVPVHVTPKALELLVALVTRPGRLITKEELVAEVWPDTFVEEGNLAVNMTRVRQALNDDSGRSYVETVPKRGYRFVAAVRAITAESSVVPGTDGDIAVESRPVPGTTDDWGAISRLESSSVPGTTDDWAAESSSVPGTTGDLLGVISRTGATKR